MATNDTPQIFTWLQAMHRTADLRFAARAVIAAMATRADNNTLEFFQTQEELAEWCGCSPRYIGQAIKDAIAAGWLIRTKQGSGRGGRASEYRLAYGKRLTQAPKTPADAPAAETDTNTPGETITAAKYPDGEIDDAPPF